MNNKVFIVTSALIIFTAITVSAFNAPNKIKVGLTSQYPDTNEIVVKNNDLVMFDKNEKEIADFDSSSNFKFVPSKLYYIGTNDTFSSFKDVMKKVELYNTGIPAYVGNGKWKVYVGGYDTKDKANSLLELAGSRDKSASHKVINPNTVRVACYVSGKTKLMIDTTEDVFFETEDRINLDKNSYRGKLILKRYNGAGLIPINYIDLDEYLKGVVSSEMESHYEIEALKAQAVAARNYAALNVQNSKHASAGYHICDSEHCQAYKGYTNETEKGNRAVKETEDEFLLYGDSVIRTYYSASSGGYTEDITNVWGSVKPYLVGVVDEYEEDDVWTREYTSSQLASRADSKYDKNIGSFKNLEPVSYTRYGRITSLNINGSKGSLTVSKDRIRSFFPVYYTDRGKRRCKSTRFYVKLQNGDYSFYMQADNKFGADKIGEITVLSANGSGKVKKDEVYVLSKDGSRKQEVYNKDKNKIVIEGNGFGHGVGMSQMGANAYAKNGYTYDEILTHYYTGTVLKKY
ncbi:MAG: SpoIID/LytB domain-containing protein [Clostridia bacterium]|jgi:stage II sporulation protein D|nr:SpoIID/LytB domain-containing protein [Clostridia bacterium]